MSHLIKVQCAMGRDYVQCAIGRDYNLNKWLIKSLPIGYCTCSKMSYRLSHHWYTEGLYCRRFFRLWFTCSYLTLGFVLQKKKLSFFFFHKTLIFSKRVIEYHVIATREGCIAGNFWDSGIDLHNSDLEGKLVDKIDLKGCFIENILYIIL